jgi:hypothetical protein
MPTQFESNCKWKMIDRKRREVKMQKLGIIKNSSKWNKLLFRKGF